MAWRIIRGISVVVGILAGGLAAAPDARAQTGWDLPEFKEATVASNRWDCGGAWDIVWPLARSGNADARLYLLLLIVSNTEPPGFGLMSSPRALWEHRMLTLSAYAALSRVSRDGSEPSHKWIRDDIPRHLKALALGAKGDQVAQCYQSGAGFRDCLDLAGSLGVIPTFEDFAEQVEKARRESGTASCRDYHGFLFKRSAIGAKYVKP
jgi:hypothetical protein